MEVSFGVVLLTLASFPLPLPSQLLFLSTFSRKTNFASPSWCCVLLVHQPLHPFLLYLSPFTSVGLTVSCFSVNSTKSGCRITVLNYKLAIIVNISSAQVHYERTYSKCSAFQRGRNLKCTKNILCSFVRSYLNSYLNQPLYLYKVSMSCQKICPFNFALKGFSSRERPAFLHRVGGPFPDTS